MKLDVGIIVVQIIFGFFTAIFVNGHLRRYDIGIGSGLLSFILVAMTTGLPIYLVRWLISLL